MNRGKHLYIAAGACMMLILILSVAYLYRGTMADNAEAGITTEQAKQIALSDAGEELDRVTFTKAKIDWDSGIPVYEVEFYTDQKSYDYEINAQTGIVRDREILIQMRTVRETENERPSAEPGSSGNDGKSVETAEQTEDKEISAAVVKNPEGEKIGVTVVKNPEGEEINAAAVKNPEDKGISAAAAPQRQTGELIGVKQAQAVALEAAGLKTEQVMFTETKLETEKGQTVYEVKFEVNGREYEYSIDAYSGRILEEEIELREGDVYPETAETMKASERDKASAPEAAGGKKENGGEHGALTGKRGEDEDREDADRDDDDWEDDDRGDRNDDDRGDRDDNDQDDDDRDDD